MPEHLVQPAPRLQEVNWLWRRLWSFLVTVASLAIVAFVVWTIRAPQVGAAQAAALQSIAYGLIGVVIFVGLIYVAGATAYEFMQLRTAGRVDIARAASEGRR